jgi:aminoglycoside phosphotransferase (APT) family kinase protein
MDVVDEVEEEFVRRLPEARRPDLAGLALRRVGRGWDNELWQLGDELAIRLPRTERAPGRLRVEHRRLPRFAPRLPPAVPTPPDLIDASEFFPQPWTIVAWVPGDSADKAEAADASPVPLLAEFPRVLHGAEPPVSESHAEPCRVLRDTRCEFGADLIGVVGEDRARELEKLWRDALSAPERGGPPVWLHNDLHPANVAVTGGALSGVIDFGLLGPGDPAVDLAAAWILLPSGSATRCLAALRRSGRRHGPPRAGLGGALRRLRRRDGAQRGTRARGRQAGPGSGGTKNT